MFFLSFAKQYIWRGEAKQVKDRRAPHTQTKRASATIYKRPIRHTIIFRSTDNKSLINQKIIKYMKWSVFFFRSNERHGNNVCNLHDTLLFASSFIFGSVYFAISRFVPCSVYLLFACARVHFAFIHLDETWCLCRRLKWLHGMKHTHTHIHISHGKSEKKREIFLSSSSWRFLKWFANASTAEIKIKLNNVRPLKMCWVLSTWNCHNQTNHHVGSYPCTAISSEIPLFHKKIKVYHEY